MAEPSGQVLLYSDSPVFSGAERVFLDVVSRLFHELEQTPRVAVPHGNVRLCAETEALTGSLPEDVAAHRGAFAGLRSRRPPISLEGVRLLIVNLPSPEFANGILRRASSGPTKSIGLVHIHQSLGGAGFRLGRARDAVARRAIRTLDEALVVSPRGLTEFAKSWRLSESRVTRLPLTWRKILVENRAEARAAIGLPPDSLVLVLPGRLTPKQKGQDVALRALALLSESNRPDLMIAGDGDDRALRRLAEKLEVGSKVWWPGRCDIARLFGAADGVLLPSRFEGLPLTALEALSCGKAGIAADVDGLGEVWPVGWRTAAGDASGLARAIERWVLRPDERDVDQLAAASRAQALCGDPGAAVLRAMGRIA